MAPLWRGTELIRDWSALSPGGFFSDAKKSLFFANRCRKFDNKGNLFSIPQENFFFVFSIATERSVGIDGKNF